MVLEPTSPGFESAQGKKGPMPCLVWGCMCVRVLCAGAGKRSNAASCPLRFGILKRIAKTLGPSDIRPNLILVGFKNQSSNSESVPTESSCPLIWFGQVPSGKRPTVVFFPLLVARWCRRLSESFYNNSGRPKPYFLEDLSILRTKYCLSDPMKTKCNAFY